MTNAADEKAIARQRDRAKTDEGIYSEVTRALMATPRGRRYVWLELSKLSVFSQTIVFAPGGPVLTAFNEGKRSVGLELLARVSRPEFADEFTKMLTENGTKVSQQKEDDNGE